MDRTLARRIVLIALAIGVAAELVLDGPPPGIGILLLTAMILVAAWVLRRRGRAPDPLDAWLPISALVLAALVAVRADPFVAFLDMASAAAFMAASVAAFSGLAVTRRSASIVMAMGAWVLEAMVAGAGRALRAARPPRGEAPRRAPAWLGPVGRGLILAVPLVLIFVVLFASADPIFRRGLDEILGIRIDLGTLPGRALFALGIAWLVGGLLTVAAAGIPAMERTSLGAAAAAPPIARERVLGVTETVIVLGAVTLVFGLFVGLQLAYLFGGLDTLAAAGLTYSDYARRGYFELVAAAGLAGGTLVALDYHVVRRPTVYLALAVALVALTVVVLASAALRLQLYQDAYGWTELRVYVAVSIVAMAVTLTALATFLATDRVRWIGHAMAVIGLASLVALNLVAPAALVAEHNLARLTGADPVPPNAYDDLDVDYLGVLPDDAIPALVAALPHLPATEADRLRTDLIARRDRLAGDPAFSSPFAWNLGRERAREALSTLP
jgi:hypothetical protein